MHLKHLRDYKNKKPFEKQNKNLTMHVTSEENNKRVKFNVDIRNETRKMVILKNKMQNRMFNMNEKVNEVFKQNVKL